MKKSFVISTIILLAISIVAMAQLSEIDEKEAFQLATKVIILSDGEQIVIRGDWEEKADRIFFYYEHGSEPIYGSLKKTQVNMEATIKANEELQGQRERREIYYKLIEARLKQAERSNNDAIIHNASNTHFTFVKRTKSGSEEEITTEFPPYFIEDVETLPLTWWQDEVAKLFAAANAANNRTNNTTAEHNSLVMQLNDTTDSGTAAGLQARIEAKRDELKSFQSLSSMIRGRIGELSALAETCEIPISALLPEDIPVFDENESIAVEPDTETISTFDIPSYDASELDDKDDAWWEAEKSHLMRMRNESIASINILQQQYNRLAAVRAETENEVEQYRISNEIKSNKTALDQANANLKSINEAIGKFHDIANQLDKNEAIGMLKMEERDGQ